MNRTYESAALSSDLEAPFRFHFGAQRESTWRSFFRIIWTRCFLLAIGIPPSLILLRPRRIPGRFIMSPYRILFIITIICGVVAAALGLKGQSGSSAWVTISGSGIMAMILFLLKEHRDAFPDFAPWLFETDYKAGCAAIAFLIVQIGIVQLPYYMWDYTRADVPGTNWMEELAFWLMIDGLQGVMASMSLHVSAQELGEPHNPFSLLFREEIVVLVPRLLVPLFGLGARKVELFVVQRALSLIMAVFLFWLAALAAQLERRFDDTFSRAAESYANTFGVEHVKESIYEPLYSLRP